MCKLLYISFDYIYYLIKGKIVEFVSELEKNQKQQPSVNSKAWSQWWENNTADASDVEHHRASDKLFWCRAECRQKRHCHGCTAASSNYVL